MQGQNKNINHLFKIIVVGDTNVGKTCLLRQYVDKNVPEKKLSTIGVEFLTK